jgi:hypothetical protein
MVQKNFPSAGHATATNMMCSDIDIFSKQIRLLKQILPQWQVLLSYGFNHFIRFKSKLL